MTLFFGQRRAVPDSSAVRALAAGSVGNFVEWYEFGVYGYFATVIAARFFTPEGGSEAEALVRTYASFALAFFFRPVGAALFGRLGDRIGRRPVLILVIVQMTVATTLIGALPTYAAVGALAPWLLTFLRVVQGLSAGGEFGGAVAVMTEFAPPEDFFYLDHDQRDTLSFGGELSLVQRTWLSWNFNYGSGFLDGDGPGHLPSYHTVDMALGKSFGERWSAKITATNIGNERYFIDLTNTFGGSHASDPRQVSVQVRYRFHY